MALILHITTRRAWDEAQAVGRYEPPGLASGGFIHCSTPAQVLRVADHLFKGRSGLVVLGVESDRVGAPVRWENCEGGPERFPHVYGPLNLDAVCEVLSFEPGPDGTFSLPAALGGSGG